MRRPPATYRSGVGRYLERLGAYRTSESGCLLPSEGKLVEPGSIVAQETIGGISTNKIVNHGWTNWFAPNLQCQLIQQEVKFSDSTTSIVLDKVTFGDPDPAQFQVSPSYAEVQPSVALERHLQHGNVPAASVARMVAQKQKEDAAYFANRPAH